MALAHQQQAKDTRRVETVPALGPSGKHIRTEVIRAMEKQQRAAQLALDELHKLADDVKHALQVGLIRIGE